jgi:hypothetical protein
VELEFVSPVIPAEIVPGLVLSTLLCMKYSIGRVTGDSICCAIAPKQENRRQIRIAVVFTVKLLND